MNALDYTEKVMPADSSTISLPTILLVSSIITLIVAAIVYLLLLFRSEDADRVGYYRRSRRLFGTRASILFTALLFFGITTLTPAGSIHAEPKDDNSDVAKINAMAANRISKKLDNTWCKDDGAADVNYCETVIANHIDNWAYHGTDKDTTVTTKNNTQYHLSFSDRSVRITH